MGRLARALNKITSDVGKYIVRRVEQRTKKKKQKQNKQASNNPQDILTLRSMQRPPAVIWKTCRLPLSAIVGG